MLSRFSLSRGGGYIVDESGRMASPLEVLSELEARTREVRRLLVALRDTCMDHTDNCPCSACKLAFRQEGE